MADNSTLPVNSGTEVFANKDIAGVKFPKSIPYDSAGAEIVPATQTTAAAILAKIIAAPATEAKQDAAIVQETATAGGIGTTADAVVAAGAAGSLSAKLRRLTTDIGSLVTAIGSTAWDLGVGTGGSRTQRIAVDTASLTAQVANNADGVAASGSQLYIPTVSYLMSWNGSTNDRVTVDATTKGLKSAGDVAHDAADAGPPVKIGGKATAALSGETLVTAGDRTQFYGDLDGASIARNACSLGDLIDGTASNTDGTSTSVIAAAGAGIKQYLTQVSLSNVHATQSTMVALKSGTTSRWRVNVPPGGRELRFDPPLRPNAANEAWSFDPDTATTTIECSMNGFKSKV